MQQATRRERFATQVFVLGFVLSLLVRTDDEETQPTPTDGAERCCPWSRATLCLRACLCACKRVGLTEREIRATKTAKQDAPFLRSHSSAGFWVLGTVLSPPSFLDLLPHSSVAFALLLVLECCLLFNWQSVAVGSTKETKASCLFICVCSAFGRFVPLLSVSFFFFAFQAFQRFLSHCGLKRRAVQRTTDGRRGKTICRSTVEGAKRVEVSLTASIDSNFLREHGSVSHFVYVSLQSVGAKSRKKNPSKQPTRQHRVLVQGAILARVTHTQTPISCARGGLCSLLP